MRGLLLLAVLLVACDPAQDDDDSGPSVVYAFAPGDAAEVEPNDARLSAMELGVIASGFEVTGASASCPTDGTFAGSDEDWFSFTPASEQPLRLSLAMRGGDLDLAVFDADGDLVADGATTGLDDEELSLALDPMMTWFVRIRCWMGNDGAIWRLRLL